MEASRGIELEELLIFERGAPGRTGASLPVSDVPDVEPGEVYGELARSVGPALPEASEPEVVRHYVRLSQQNASIDTTFYPLGSCTMKFNPKVNEWAARIPGFARLHPYAPERTVQGALELMWRLERGLAEICGMDHVSLQPAAGAQGELLGLMMIRAHHQREGRSPRKVLVPDSAHGTNPASTALNGMVAVPVPAGPGGILELDAVARVLDDDVAAIMVTNPNTLGLFESELPRIAELAHARGALVYGDGANLNAIMGRARPGDLGIDVMQFNLHKTFTTPHGGGGPGCGPVGYKAKLHAFAPIPQVVRGDDGRFSLLSNRGTSVGRMRSFVGNFGMMVRAYAYLREMGAEGLARATDLAVLNANYLRTELRDSFHLPYDSTCMHEVVFTDKLLREHDVSTMDVAKRLIDHGFHPPTVYFPLVVKGALMIEPTETESRQTLDEFVAAMRAIAEEARTHPARVKGAPHTTRLRRLDEARAARKPVLRWRPEEGAR